jgi:hypothetical protein
MKFKALITSLVLASSSVVLADSAVGFKVDGEGELQFRDRRFAPSRPMWKPLSSMITASRRTTIRVEENKDNLSAIRLQTGSGATYIYSLTLRFDDGSRESIPVGKWLYSGAPLMTFDLPQHRGGLDRITVTTWTSATSTYQILGQSTRFRPRPLPPVIDPPVPPPPPVYTGLVVGSGLSFENTPGYVHIPVGTDRGRFSKVKIEAIGSSTMIGSVYVTYATGKHQRFEVNKSFYRGETVELDLEGNIAQTITAITVIAGNDVRAVGPSAGKFNVSVL